MASKETEVVVVGAGPGGYAAAFHAADLGLKTTLVDTREQPGGVCLFVGCIPSKALLFVSEVLGLARDAGEFGLDFNDPKIDLKKLRNWKEKIVKKLTGGLGELARRRGVDFIRGRAVFESSQTLRVEKSDVSRIDFQHAIVATGSRPTGVPGINIKSDRIMDSTGALEIADVPRKMLVVGGGYIGLELGSVYASIGSKVSVVELTDGLLPGVDRDLVRPLHKRLEGLFSSIHLKSKVVEMKETKQGISVKFEGEIQKKTQNFEKVLLSVGRRPNSDHLGLENTGVEIDKNGFLKKDERQRTSDERIFAIGDVAGQPMLAHKAFREGKVAAEAIAGKPSAFDNRAIPAVVFTDPEVAWCGMTETQAKEEGREVRVEKFPWAASGRALTLGRAEGLTKMIFEPETGQVLGVGIVGPHAGEMIAEAVLAVEMGAVAEDLASTIHTHPTLSETTGEVAEAFLGQALHTYRPR